ncbi:LytR/AlgR family response regulator transcription factor, partial [Grimontia celer]|uniref:LytR/AlgR family response regulator transcription factor n=2 Tax=Pseudomonadati TaxID=3379134 RepID=UPI0018D4CDE1
IPIDQIVCLCSENKATYIHTNANRNYLIDNSLEYWQKQLNPECFFRVNRTFIIHINAIKDIISYTNSRLQLMLNYYDKTEIIVSR